MLYRNDSAGVIGIAQPAHAWVSGQLARAWGNERFGVIAPYAELCLAAEQHDIGMAAWENAPTLNPQTGRAYSFLELPEPLHTEIFAAASRLLVSQNRYAALLTSRHFTGLASRHDLETDPPNVAQAIRNYLDQEELWQTALTASLLEDPAYAPYVAPVVLARNSSLLAVWDWFSLRLLMGFTERTTISDVPMGTTKLTLHLTQTEADPMTITVDPWPFQGELVVLTCEGRRLGAPVSDETALHAALAQAPWVTLRFTLQPGGA